MKGYNKLYAAFAVCTIVFLALSLAVGIVVLREVRAVNQCLYVTDDQFGTCYRSAK